jgi:hypothetical protein
MEFSASARPASRLTLSDKLQAHGIDTRPNTTIRWATLAKRDWTAYLAARAEDLQKGRT